MKGAFINFYQPFKTGESIISPEIQARSIVSAAERINQNFTGVAIIYSANYDQTVALNKLYSQGRWKTNIRGINQAQVITEIESLLLNENPALGPHFRVAPITTMTYSDYGGLTHESVVEDDLTNIETLLSAGWAVLGWINDTTTKPLQYAIGGGVSGSSFPSTLHQLVQSSLEEFAINYPSKPINL